MTAFKIFKIKPEERIQSLVALVVIVLLNALFIYRNSVLIGRCLSVNCISQAMIL